MHNQATCAGAARRQLPSDLLWVSREKVQHVSLPHNSGAMMRPAQGARHCMRFARRVIRTESHGRGTEHIRQCGRNYCSPIFTFVRVPRVPRAPCVRLISTVRYWKDGSFRAVGGDGAVETCLQIRKPGNSSMNSVPSPSSIANPTNYRRSIMPIRPRARIVGTDEPVENESGGPSTITTL